MQNITFNCYARNCVIALHSIVAAALCRQWMQRCQQNHDKLQDECSQKKNQGTIVDAGADANNSIATENSLPIILCYNAATVILSPTVVHVASSIAYNTLSRHEIC